MRTAVRGGAVVAFDGTGHRLIPSGVVVFEGDRITHVGSGYAEESDREIDARGCLVTPGFINLHTHGGYEAGGRLILDSGRPDIFNTGYMNYYTTKPGKAPIYLREDPWVGALHYLAESVKFGSTTVVDVGGGTPELVKAAVQLGVRVYASPGYASARYVDRGSGRVDYDWDEERGRAGLQRAVAFVREYAGQGSGLFQGMLFPHAVDTCSQDLLERSLQAAADLGVQVQIHTAQGLFEFTEMMRRTQLTPVRWLHSIGALSSRIILGHAIFLDHHPLAPAQGRKDLGLVAASGAHVAHCPLIFARRGWALHSFDRYREAGVNVGLGTDTCPRDIIDEMRWGSYVCKLVEGDLTAGQPADLFNAATLSGSAALGRSDLGRLAPGAKADLVIMPMDTVRVSPVMDPVKSLIHHVAGTPARCVVVDGRVVVDQGRVVGVDEAELMREVQSGAQELWSQTPDWDGLSRTAGELCPPAFPMWAETERRGK